MARPDVTTRQPEGLSLLETLVALLLLSIGLLAVAPMFAQAMRSNAAGSDFGVAGAAAVARLERLRELDYDSPELAPGGSVTANATVAGVDYFDASDPEVLVRWQVATNGALAGTKVITICAIARAPVVGQARQATLVTLRGE